MLIEFVFEILCVVEEDPHGDTEILGLILNVDLAEPRGDSDRPGDRLIKGVLEEFDDGDIVTVKSGDGVNNVVLDWTAGVSEFTTLIEAYIFNEEDGDALSDKRCSAVLEIMGVWEDVPNEEAELLNTVEADTDGTRLDVSRGVTEGSKDTDAYELYELDGSGDDVYVLETLELSDT